MMGKRLFACLLISITANTYAAGDPTAGQEKSAACQGCHGADGNSYSPDWPNLASPNPNSLVKQIHDFQSGARQDPTMSTMVTGLSEADIADITAFFSTQAVQPDAEAKSPAGKKLYEGGNRYTKLPACAGCHGPNGVGNDPGFIPRLAGQKATYTAKQLRDFRAETRSNDRSNIMREIAAKMSDKEIDAVSAYLAGLGAAEK